MIASQAAHPEPDRLEQLAAWWMGPEARALWHREADAAEDWLSRCFGYHAALLGLQPALFGELRGLRIPHPFTLGPRAGDVRGQFEALPLAEESVDLVLLHHVLEYALDPHEVLREVDRVLLPEGHVLLMNFNPMSLWGLRRLLHGNRKVPWCGRSLGRGRLCDWLGLLGFDVLAETWVGHGGMRAAPRREKGGLERFGMRLLPHFGMSHLLLARKRVSMPTPIRQRWSLAPVLGVKGRELVPPIGGRHPAG